jgi:hypothetical protein
MGMIVELEIILGTDIILDILSDIEIMGIIEELENGHETIH